MENGIPETPLDPAAVKAAEDRLLAPQQDRQMQQLVEAMCDPTRVRIVQALSGCELAAGDLAHVIGRSRSATSQHLKVLRDLGAVVATRNGNIVRYSLSSDLNGEVLADCVSAFDRLKKASGGALGCT